MSTAPPTSPVPPPGQPSSPEQLELKIVSHSNLFYWWPVWLIGFMMAFLTWLDGHRMAIVPAHTQAFRSARVEYEEKPGTRVTIEGQDVLVVPKGQLLPPSNKDVAPEQPRLFVAANKSYGVLYGIVLLLVIVITNVPLRGLWSLIAIIVIVFVSIIFALMDWWEPILEHLGALHIHMNAVGYLIISGVLFAIWLVTLLLFDPQVYMVFSPGQLRVRQEIGGGETAYDTMGMVIQKQRNDLFRHWILGLGSGDLIVNTSGARAVHFDLPNVLFVGYKVKQIEEMLREKQVVPGKT